MDGIRGAAENRICVDFIFVDLYLRALETFYARYPRMINVTR